MLSHFMSLAAFLPDAYDLNARLRPVVNVCLPPILTIFSLVPIQPSLSIAGSLITLCALTAMCSQLGRDAGKRKEPALFKYWGGTPTSQLLRHSSDYLPADVRNRYCSALEQLVPQTKLPTRAEEEGDLASADRRYDSYVRYLREHTRDKNRFPLVYAENVNYGFRRNLWAMKPVGLTLAALSAIIATVATTYKYVAGLPIWFPAFVAVLSSIFFLFWIFRFTPDWVRTPAFAYAERLLATSEELSPRPQQNSPIILPNS